MRDPMPTAAQARVMLHLLVRLPRTRLDGSKPVNGMVMWRRGWIQRGPIAITPAGRGALYRYLLRTFTGPVVVVEWQPPMKPDEARVMLAIVTCREFKAPTELLGYLSLRRWVGLSRVSRGKLVATTSGREALISYLLRDFHA